MASTTLAGSFLSGTHASRPAANAVVGGALYAETDTGKIYQSDGVSTWTQWGSTAGPANPMTTQDDLIIGGASGIQTRLAKGTDGQVLTVDPTTHHLVWATPGGGGGGVTVQFPALKPGSPTYDFAAASLDVAFSAHSSQGSFGTGNCTTQGVEWMGSALEMQFSEQMGALYVSHANGDLDFSVGGVKLKGAGGTGSSAWGIAALDSSGNGVGLLVDMAGGLYSCTISAWGAGSVKTNWASHGFTGVQGANTDSVTAGDVWFRITRVSGTWTYYASLSGRAWDKVYTTSADSVTVDRLAFGMFYSTGATYSGRLIADYFHVAV